MSWLGLVHKGTEPLYSDEWNRVVDGLDILYGYVSGLDARKLDRDALRRLDSDVIPLYGCYYALGDAGREWLAVYGCYGYFKHDVYVSGRRVIRDGDPVKISAFIEEAKADIDRLYGAVADIRDAVRGALTSTGADSFRVEIALDGVGLAREATQEAIRVNTDNIDVPLSQLKSRVDEIYSVVTALSEKVERRILQFDDGAVAQDARFAQRVELGRAFSASHRFEGVADGAAVESFFENPGGSGRVVNIVSVEVALLGQAWIDIYRDNVKVEEGVRMPAFNLNMASSMAPAALPEYGGQYEAGRLVHSTVAPGGRLVRVLGSVVEVGERVKMPPGYNILVRITNRAGVATDMSIRYIWWEDVLS